MDHTAQVIGVSRAGATRVRYAVLAFMCSLSVITYLDRVCISVTANVAPRLLSEMHGAWQRGDLKSAMTINERLTPLHEALFCEASPGPVKHAASLLGHCQSDLRLPLCEIGEGSKQKVQGALASAGLIN